HGSARNSSATLIKTSSFHPPQNPAADPMHNPIDSVSPTPISPASNDTCPPKRTRESKSRPYASLPSKYKGTPSPPNRCVRNGSTPSTRYGAPVTKSFT